MVFFTSSPANVTNESRILNWKYMIYFCLKKKQMKKKKQKVVWWIKLHKMKTIHLTSCELDKARLKVLTFAMKVPSPIFSLPVLLNHFFFKSLKEREREKLIGPFIPKSSMFSVYFGLFPWREAGDVWCLHPVWHLRAVIWFHFAISSLVLLLSPIILSVFFYLLVHSSELFPENSSICFVKR